MKCPSECPRRLGWPLKLKRRRSPNAIRCPLVWGAVPPQEPLREGPITELGQVSCQEPCLATERSRQQPVGDERRRERDCDMTMNMSLPLTTASKPRLFMRIARCVTLVVTYYLGHNRALPDSSLLVLPTNSGVYYCALAFSPRRHYRQRWP